MKASAAIAWWVGTSREIEARAAAGRRHVVASRAHAAEGNRAKAQAHLSLAERLFQEIEDLRTAAATGAKGIAS